MAQIRFHVRGTLLLGDQTLRDGATITLDSAADAALIAELKAAGTLLLPEELAASSPAAAADLAAQRDELEAQVRELEARLAEAQARAEATLAKAPSARTSNRLADEKLAE